MDGRMLNAKGNRKNIGKGCRRWLPRTKLEPMDKIVLPGQYIHWHGPYLGRRTRHGVYIRSIRVTVLEVAHYGTKDDGYTELRVAICKEDMARVGIAIVGALRRGEVVRTSTEMFRIWTEGKKARRTG